MLVFIKCSAASIAYGQVMPDRSQEESISHFHKAEERSMTHGIKQIPGNYNLLCFSVDLYQGSDVYQLRQCTKEGIALW